MVLQYEGPWQLRELINKPQSPVSDKTGNYLVSIPQEDYQSERHGLSRFIYIGGMRSPNGSLSKRLGEFVAATFGFSTWHAGGNTFFERKEDHDINPWDLEFWWYVSNDPICGELQLFKEFEVDFKGKPYLNKQGKRSGCTSPRHPIKFKIPWR